MTSRVDVGPFSSRGVYEEFSGRIFFTIDPLGDANRIIADIDRAPRDAAGRVEFSANFILLKPKETGHGNGTVLLDVANRGNRVLFRVFNRPASDGPEWGDGFLMAQGFTLLWVGWQFDVPPKPGALRIDVPIARQLDGRVIEGLVRSDAPDKRERLELADRGHIPYPPADPTDPANVLTVRDCVECPRRVLPREQWRFNEDGKSVFISASQPRKIYELIYKSRNPPVVGLGLAAVRDVLSKLKYGSTPELALPRGAIRQVLGFGASQGGRFLRTFIHHGFNGDEARRKVFDGLIVHVAGAGRGSFNHRFAQPSRDAHPYLNFFYPTDIFPFTDVEQLDPITRQSAGLMGPAASPFLPKVFHVNTSYEYWGRCASLIHTTIDGRADAQMMDNVRVYLFAGGKHAPGGEPVASESQQQLSNPLDYSWGLRKLLLAMDRWVADGTLPPPSAYPRVDDGSLVRPEILKFPKIPGVNPPGPPTQSYRLDYGPQFLISGIVTREPPGLGARFPILVPQVDSDGNELAGIRLPEQAVPLATFTGWALFHPRAGPPDLLALGAGSYIPFPRTRSEREHVRDPRRSLEERYRGRKHYLSLINASAASLVSKGYILESDVPQIVAQAGARWDFNQALRRKASPGR